MFEGLRARVAHLVAPKAAGQRQAPAAIGAMATLRQPPKRGSAELIAAYKTTPWLHSVTSRIADSVAAVPWMLEAKTAAGGKAVRSKAYQRAPLTKRARMRRHMKQAGELRVIEDHPLLDLLARGNPLLSGRTCIELTQVYLDIQGEAFWVLERNALGVPVEIWPAPPHWCREVPTAAKPFFQFEYSGMKRTVAADDVLWFRYPDPTNPYGRGTGIAEALADELDIDEYASKYVKTFFYNSALPDAVISFEGADPKQIDAAEARWMDKYRGTHNAHRISFTNRKVDVKLLQQSFRDQQLVDLRGKERDTIVQVFGVPPEVVGIIENSNRSTIDGAEVIFAKWVLVPRLERLRDVMQAKLVPMFDERLVLAFESPVPEDREFWLKVAQANPAALTRAEWRESMGAESHGPVDEVYVMPIGVSERRVSDPAGPPPAAPKPEPEPEPDDDDDDEPVEDEEKGGGAPRVKVVDARDIAAILEALRPERLTAATDDVIEDLVKAWGNAALADLGLSNAFNMLNPLVTDHLREVAGDRIGGMVTDTTREALRATLAEGVAAGEGIRELAARVGQVFEDADSWRAITIARTEVVRSANFSTFTAYDQAGIVKEKQWVSTPDDRTRDAHTALHGQQRPIDSPFEIGGATAMYPGDFGVAELDINCRCTISAVIGEPKSAEVLARQWKAFDENLLEWEDEVTDALRDGFKRQRDDVMAALMRRNR
jgi:HK97 family phage portal protein